MSEKGVYKKILGTKYLGHKVVLAEVLYSKDDLYKNKGSYLVL